MGAQRRKAAAINPMLPLKNMGCYESHREGDIGIEPEGMSRSSPGGPARGEVVGRMKMCRPGRVWYVYRAVDDPAWWPNAHIGERRTLSWG